MDDRERQRHMKAALALVGKGAGYVAPNPMGGVIFVTLERCYHQGKTG